MKKKLLTITMAFVTALAGLLPCFLSAGFSSKSQDMAFGSGIESEYYTDSSIDLISANLSSGLSNAKIENGITPYNSETKARYEGNAVTPNAGEYGEFQNMSFGIEGGYNPKLNDAIFLWVYLLKVQSFSLRISIANGVDSDTLTWEIPSQKLRSAEEGWKFLQLNLKDHAYTNPDFVSKTYTSIVISYCSETVFDPTVDLEGNDPYENIETKTSERFSFYHVFASENVASKNSTGIILNLQKSYYEYSDDFNIAKTVYVGDSVLIKTAKDIFKVLYVGKYDLTNFATETRYYWNLIITYPDESTKTLGMEKEQYINFNVEGFHRLTIQLQDQNGDSILNSENIIYCDELALGGFLMGSKYSMKDNEKMMISFVISDGLELLEDYTVSINNNYARVYSNYEEDGVIYVYVEGLSKGTSLLEIKAKAKSLNGTKQRDLVASATITIKQSKSDTDFFTVTMWILFGCFSVGILVYMAISVVKARKNDVK